MPFNTEQGRSRTRLASILRMMFGPVALLVSLHAEPMVAVAPGVVSLAAPSENAAVSAEAELPVCALTDISLAGAPGSCRAATPEAATLEAATLEAATLEAATPEAVTADVETPDVVAGAAQEPAVAPTDDAADRAAPMCASDGTSIAALVEIPEIDRGHFEPLPCDAQVLLALFGSQLREGGIPRVAARESLHRGPLQSPALNDGNDGIGAVSVPPYWPERAPPSTLARHRRGGLAWQPGHRSRIDRPPSLA